MLGPFHGCFDRFGRQCHWRPDGAGSAECQLGPEQEQATGALVDCRSKPRQFGPAKIPLAMNCLKNVFEQNWCLRLELPSFKVLKKHVGCEHLAASLCN